MKTVSSVHCGYTSCTVVHAFWVDFQKVENARMCLNAWSMKKNEEGGGTKMGANKSSSKSQRTCPCRNVACMKHCIELTLGLDLGDWDSMDASPTGKTRQAQV